MKSIILIWFWETLVIISDSLSPSSFVNLVKKDFKSRPDSAKADSRLSILTPSPSVKNVSGFIAQDVEDTNFNDLVGNFKHNSLDDCKSFQYSGLIPALVKAIQELEARIKTLEG